MPTVGGEEDRESKFFFLESRIEHTVYMKWVGLSCKGCLVSRCMLLCLLRGLGLGKVWTLSPKTALICCRISYNQSEANLSQFPLNFEEAGEGKIRS